MISCGKPDAISPTRRLELAAAGHCCGNYQSGNLNARSQLRAIA